MQWNKSGWMKFSVWVLVTAVIVLGLLLLKKERAAEAGYTIVLMSSVPPAQAMIRWQTIDKPKVVGCGVEWTDSNGRDRIMLGNVYVEQNVIAAAAPAPAQPAEAQPEVQPAAEEEETDGE